MRPLRTLLFSTLYPSSQRPVHGIFVETRLRHLLTSGEVETRVVAPVPWFPFRHACFGRYAKLAATPRQERWHDIQVEHPRYFLPPKVGTVIAPDVLAAGAWPAIQRMLAEGFDFDLIDAHYFYPDGAAAAKIARRLNKPLLITARGSDVTLFKQFPGPRQRIVDAANQAAGCIGVCRDLMAQLEELGVDPGKTHVIRNGVDTDRFVMLDRDTCRRDLGIESDGPVFVSVGRLEPVKGHDLSLRLLAELPAGFLLIVGDGPARGELEQLTATLGLGSRVRFCGAQPQTELARYYSAADVMILASSREGWANVLLESMACGTPVVATAVNGTPEVVAAPEAGRLAASRSVDGLRAALDDLLRDPPARTAVRAYAERFGWEETTRAQLRLFREVLDAHY